MGQWTLQQAKTKFSQVVDEARTDVPQIITRRGQKAAVVLSYEAYLGLIRPRRNILDRLLPDEDLTAELDVTRDASLGRGLDL